MAKSKKIEQTPAEKRAETDKKIHDYIQKNPQVTAEAIRINLEMEAPDVAASLLRLRRGSYVNATGATRAMAYKVTRKVLAA